MTKKASLSIKKRRNRGRRAKMIFFTSDYSAGAHPRVMDALVRTNTEHTDGYFMDEH